MRRAKKMSPEEHTAFHEAGHAVASVVLSGKVGRVTIVEDSRQDSLGSTCTTSSLELARNIEGLKTSRSAAWILGTQIQRMVFALAGETAARRASGRKDKVGSDDDYGHVADYALGIALDKVEANALIAWLERRTDLLIKTHWKPIKALAAALLRQKTLTGKQAREIVLSTPPA